LAERLGRPGADLRREAAAAIDEMVACQSRAAIDVWGQFGRWLSRAYRVDVDRSGFDRLRELNRCHPLVFLPSHRSYLDPLVLRTALHAQGFPPNHVLGGINVGFWPIGPIARRSGYVFIRRSFRGDEVYKLALREYMAYLMRKRFNLEWYIEGGRSRTGKLRPPRYGLLAYLVEAFREGRMDDRRAGIRRAARGGRRGSARRGRPRPHGAPRAPRDARGAKDPPAGRDRRALGRASSTLARRSRRSAPMRRPAALGRSQRRRRDARRAMHVGD
jgi:Acyltransferase